MSKEYRYGKNTVCRWTQNMIGRKKVRRFRNNLKVGKHRSKVKKMFGINLSDKIKVLRAKRGHHYK